MTELEAAIERFRRYVNDEDLIDIYFRDGYPADMDDRQLALNMLDNDADALARAYLADLDARAKQEAEDAKEIDDDEFLDSILTKVARGVWDCKALDGVRVLRMTPTNGEPWIRFTLHGTYIDYISRRQLRRLIEALEG